MPAQIFVFYSRLANELMLIYRKNAVISLKTSVKRHESLAHINSSRGYILPCLYHCGGFCICRRCRNQKMTEAVCEAKIVAEHVIGTQNVKIAFETEKTIHDAVSEPRKQTKTPCRDPQSKLKHPAGTEKQVKTPRRSRKH